MSRTERRIVPDVHKEMAKVFKRKSGQHIRPISRTRDREDWQKEWEEEEETNRLEDACFSQMK